jgi:hypothetical protein
MAPELDSSDITSASRHVSYLTALYSNLEQLAFEELDAL